MLEPGQAPALERRIAEIRAALDAPRAQSILLTDDFNAAVTQVPRLGIFGFPRTYLILGVPLMYALDKRQLDAVLAHEFAHLSGSHPKIGLRMYRISRTWQQLLTQLHEGRSWGKHLFESFVNWYAPRLQAHGFVMSRRDEYEADADAARIAGADAMAEALVALDIRGRTLGELFWPGVWSRVETDSAPPERTWTTLPQALQAELPEPLKIQWLSKAFSRRALDNDTHPSLRERLTALGIAHVEGPDTATMATRLIPPLQISAAEHYLGERGGELLGAMERAFTEGVREAWSSRHQEVRTRRGRVDALIAREVAGERLEDHELWELATRVAELDGDQASIPLLRRVLEVLPENYGAHFMLGRALLATEDGAGVEHITIAMDGDVDAVPAGTAILRQFFAERGDLGGIAQMQQREYEFAQLMKMAAAERDEVRKDDTLVAAALVPEEMEQLRTMAEGNPRVVRMWVARKITQHFPERPMIVILIEPKWWRVGFRESSDQKLAQEVLQAVSLSFTCDLQVLVLNGQVTWLWKRLMKLPGAEVFAR